MAIEGKISNSKLVTDIFGYWPTFHDAEILTLSLERSGDAGPQLIATIQAHEITSEVDEKGYYVLKNRTLVEIRFSGIKELELFDFNRQNALLALEIDEIANLEELKVVFNAAYGLAGTFCCERIEVTSATPMPASSPKAHKSERETRDS